MRILINEAINSLNNIWFLKTLHNWITSNSYFGYERVILLLDNWAYHKSSTSISILLKLGYTIVFLPAYSPEIAPIEMYFSILRRNLRDSLKKERVRFSVRNNKTKIFDSLVKIKEDIIKNKIA